MKKYIIYIFLLTFTSCYISKKVETPCTLKVNSSFDVTTIFPDEFKYMNESLKSTYKEKFIEGIKDELTLYNVTVVSSNEAKADFELVITTFKLTESRDVQTVNDAASPYNGQSYALHSCDASVDFVLYSNGKKVGNWWARVSKEEKLTNNRNVGDYVFGTNKDGSEYRHKQLDENIFEDLSQRAGRRTAAKITKKISK